jgi:hypothetical protein
MSAIDTTKKSKEWQDFSRLNMQSSVNISLADMQKQVSEEVASDRDFLESSGLRK